MVVVLAQWVDTRMQVSSLQQELARRLADGDSMAKEGRTLARQSQEALAALQKEFNNGEPDRLGSERNYARYQERVEEMRSALARKQADVAALRRELAKLPAAQ